MNEKLFEKWSATLNQLRADRFDEIDRNIKDKGKLFSANEFFDIVTSSLNQLIMHWWNYEAESIQTGKNVPPNSQEITEDLQSVIDIEVEAITREMDEIRERVAWSEDAVEMGILDLQKTAESIQNMYIQKIDAISQSHQDPMDTNNPVNSPSDTPLDPISAGPVLEEPPKIKSTRPRTHGRSPSGASGFGLLLMLMLGLVLGFGPSYYFWDQNTKINDEWLEKESQWMEEKKTFENTLSVYQENFRALAQGKKESISDVESRIDPIKSRFESLKKKTVNDYNDQKANLMKKIPPGDKLDRSLEKLEKTKEDRLADLERQEKQQLQKHYKNLEMLKNLSGM